MKKKVSDEVLLNSYKRIGNVWKVGQEVGLCGQSVYDRLVKLHAIKRKNKWQPSDDEVLISKYKIYKKDFKLDELAKELGRTKQFICRQAKRLGLTDPKDINVPHDVRIAIGNKTREWIKQKGHPKGFMNHTHSSDARKRISLSSTKAWGNPNSKFNTDEFRQRRSDNLHHLKLSGKMYVYSKFGDHKIKIEGKEYIFKSGWELEVAKRLQEIKLSGRIKRWGYESKHFVFSDMKRYTRSYCPDFEVELLNGDTIYIEVKGYYLGNSKERIAMFRERYKQVKLIIIEKDEYNKMLAESDYFRRYAI